MGHSFQSGIDFLNKGSDDGFNSVNEACKAGFESLGQSSKAEFRLLSEASKGDYESLRSVSRSGFESLDAVSRAGFASLDQACKSGNLSLKEAGSEQFESLSQLCMSGFESLRDSSSVAFLSQGQNFITSFNSLNQALLEGLDTLASLVRQEDNKRFEKVENELQEARIKLAQLKNPGDAIEKLSLNLKEEKVRKDQLVADLEDARRHIDTLAATREAMEFLKDSSQVYFRF